MRCELVAGRSSGLDGLVGDMKRFALLVIAAGVAGCAQGGGSFNITCATQTGGDSSAMSCATITISGNTPTASPTTTATVPVQVGPGSLPGLPLAGLLPMTANGAMALAPPPQTIGARAAPRHQHSTAPPPSSVLSLGPPPKKTSDLETIPWPEFWARTTTHIHALDDPRPIKL